MNYKKVSRARFELATFCVLDRCDNQLRHRPLLVPRLSGRTQFDPGDHITVESLISHKETSYN